MNLLNHDSSKPLLAALVLVVACGGSSGTSGSGGTGSGGTAGSGATGGSSGSGGGPAGSCPASPPTEGAACTAPWSSPSGGPAAHCSWGDDPRSACRTQATCGSAGWHVKAPAADPCGTSPLPPQCPAPPPANETVCDNSLITCFYADGTHCWCSSCKGGSGYPSCQTINPPEWYCSAPGTGCPKTLPNAGTPCSVPDTDCSPSCNLEVKCQGGVWQWLTASCPVCAAPNTPIATPSGERPIAELRAGDLVYSVDDSAIVVVPLLRVGHTAVHSHHVMRVVLADGHVLEVSPRHPTADGRTFGELRAGGALDPEHAIVNAELVPYAYSATYDILPASSSGTYFAAGALIGSTLR